MKYTKMKPKFIFLSVLLTMVLVACGTPNSSDIKQETKNELMSKETVPLEGKTEKTREVEATKKDDVSATSKFDLETGTVMLNNGIQMPILGIGTYCVLGIEGWIPFDRHCKNLRK